MDGLRFDMHRPRNTDSSDNLVTQRYFQYDTGEIKVRAGSFYERLGRGLVFHAFEIQSQTVDGVEQTLAIDRNIDGVNLQILLDRFEFTGIWGKAPKPFGSKRGDPLGGAEVRFLLTPPLTFGGSALRYQDADFRDRGYHVDMYAANLGIQSDVIEIYSEYSVKRSSDPASTSHGNAVYATIGLYGERIGISAEFKRYENFTTPFNNPPALVNTHSFVLLNRHTHTLNANDEIGYQLEGYVNLSETAALTLHASGANNLANNSRRRFREWFLESQNEWSNHLSSRVLLDYSEDRPVGDLGRCTAAGEVEYRIDEKNSVLADIQVQQISNENSGKFGNYLALLAFSRSPWLTLSMQHEWTDAPLTSRKNWTLGALSLKVGEHHDFLLTFGARREGLVCSGGICTFLPEFRGTGLTWNMRF